MSTHTMRPMDRRTLVTGFLPFGGFAVNPAALLAGSLGRPFELIEVSFAAVDAFLDRVATADEEFDRLVMLGLRGGGTVINLEHLARNHVGPEPDVRGVIRGPGPVDPSGPETVRTTLFDGTALASGTPSVDAGCYLCNYIYYRALRRLSGTRVGFVHVPPTSVMPLQVQRQHLATLLDLIERTG